MPAPAVRVVDRLVDLADVPATPAGDGLRKTAAGWEAVAFAALDGSGRVPWALLAGAPANVKDAAFGAKGDGKTVTDGQIVAGALNTLVSPSAGFTPGRVGNVVSVGGGGVGGEQHLTTIAGYVDPSHVTLAAPAVNPVAGATVVFGTDDAPAIQAAINTGADVVLPDSATYVTNATLTLAVVGQRVSGPRNAVLKRVNAGYCVKVSGTRVKLDGFDIDGNVNLKAAWSAVLNQGSHVLMTGLGIHNASGHGVQNGLAGGVGACDNVHIRDCEIYSNGQAGIAQNQSVDAHIIDNHIYSNGFEGITVDNASWRSIIRGNRIVSNCSGGGAGAISLDKGDLAVIVGNYIDSVLSGQSGIIANNNLAGGCSWVNVTGNTILNAQGYAVRLRNNGGNICDHWVVTSNITRGTGLTPIINVENGCTNVIDTNNIGT